MSHDQFHDIAHNEFSWLRTRVAGWVGGLKGPEPQPVVLGAPAYGDAIRPLPIR